MNTPVASSKNDWALIPGNGLGSILFSMPKEEVSSFNFLGKIITEGDIYPSQEIVEDTFDKFFADQDPEILKEIKAALESAREENPKTIRQSWSSGITLSYTNGLLSEIFADDRALDLHFDGVPVFDADPLPLVRKLNAALSEVPTIGGEELVFARNHIYLWAFLKEDQKSGFLKSDNTEKTICWRATPRSQGVDTKDYHPLLGL